MPMPQEPLRGSHVRGVHPTTGTIVEGTLIGWPRKLPGVRWVSTADGVWPVTTVSLECVTRARVV